MQFSGTKLGQSEINFRPNDHTVKENYMVHDVNQTFPVTSTPRPDKMEISSNRDVSDFGVLVEELGRKIGESVTARLLSEGGLAGTSDKKNTRNEKEPPVFRGDNLGRCDVQEWVDMMQLKRETCEHVNADPESVLTCFKQGTSGSHESKPDAKDQSSLN
ncbi:Nibrin [Labeo rohita]|uniref:Nibrin n=1 Tax=Labeo rohita TaxID=84645 RepID=A0ABQ8KZ12_LABRO|nr:Nibrin [Labeo rohita]